jgi:hypothetical protein
MILIPSTTARAFKNADRRADDAPESARYRHTNDEPNIL